MITDVQAALFDLDGTLVNTIPLILASYEHTLGAHLAHIDVPRRVIIGNLGRSLNDILRDYAVAGGAADPDALSDEMVETYRSFQRENIDRLIEPYDGIAEMLSGLHARGLTLGLVTSKVEWAARLSYERYDIARFLSILVFHDDTPNHKPHPEPLLHAAAKAGLVPGRTVYVGDSVHDMAAGRAAGMKTIGALWGPSEPGDLERAGADALASDPRDLLTIVQQRG
jgi:pyrophosphatase PpaX